MLSDLRVGLTQVTQLSVQLHTQLCRYLMTIYVRTNMYATVHMSLYNELHAGGYADEAVVLIAYEQWNVTLHSFEEGNEHVITV